MSQPERIAPNIDLQLSLCVASSGHYVSRMRHMLGFKFNKVSAMLTKPKADDQQLKVTKNASYLDDLQAQVVEI